MEWYHRDEIDALAKYFKSMNRILPHPDAWPQVKARVDRAVRRLRGTYIQKLELRVKLMDALLACSSTTLLHTCERYICFSLGRLVFFRV